MRISFRVKGGFSRTTSHLEKLRKVNITRLLDKYGRAGVAALSSATPTASGFTAASWSYKIEVGANTTSLIFCNSHVNKGVPIAIILQYGHGTGTGGYVQGRDYINPAIRPVFDSLANEAWKEVTKS